MLRRSVAVCGITFPASPARKAPTDTTAAGARLLSHARLALSILDKAVEEVRLLHGGPGARVVIAVTPMVGATVLPRVLREYEALQPETEVHITEGLLTQVLPDLIEGRLDFAIAVADATDLPYEIVFEPLGPADAVLAARGPPAGGGDDLGRASCGTRNG